MRQLTASQKIAQLENRIARLEKQAFFGRATQKHTRESIEEAISKGKKDFKGQN